MNDSFLERKYTLILAEIVVGDYVKKRLFLKDRYGQLYSFRWLALVQFPKKCFALKNDSRALCIIEFYQPTKSQSN